MPLRLLIPSIAMAALLACAPAASRVADADRVAKCRFAAPAAMPAGPKRWYGACAAGQAQGSGVLRGAEAAFYGTMAKGRPVRGAIEDASGLMIGRFEGTRLVQSDQRQDNLDGLKVAAGAARAVSARFARAGNRGSAAFYAGKARMLDDYIR